MKYYAHINSKGKLTGIDITVMEKDGYGSERVQNIEVTESIYKNREKYIYSNGEIILNPNYNIQALARAKENKYQENDSKAEKARYNQEFTITIQNKECVFDTKEKTQTDLLTAFAVCSTGETYDGWVTNNGVELDLTLNDVALISAVFKQKSSVYGQWNGYKTAIDNATTVEEVEAIEIEYEVI